ncbi:hypothetical protein OG2516_18790 [Oceanicola granulosus HTCC2516]|uniref:Uncharacterized protein n=1 Tax=Oceanicola granulosus (strain ATCC BAA-861 / DSM 15982 / KCTC 12143 / HTCC2516) TaxID=314256 RepID=Q2CH98_OCEGH|nr:hypothetical protein OG2516_18790 [Oceanicola granulosus HTCC2516]
MGVPGKIVWADGSEVGEKDGLVLGQPGVTRIGEPQGARGGMWDDEAKPAGIPGELRVLGRDTES